MIGWLAWEHGQGPQRALLPIGCLAVRTAKGPIALPQPAPCTCNFGVDREEKCARFRRNVGWRINVCFEVEQKDIVLITKKLEIYK
jgi:hypothetical protein